MTTQTVSYENELIAEIHKTPKGYLPNLLQIVHLYRESVTLKSAAASFEQGMHEAVAGETSPLSELWDDIDVAK